MRTYYRGYDAIVTGETFVWLTGSSRQAFMIAELTQVGRTTIRVRKWRTLGFSRPLFALAATYRNEHISLYTTSDERVFNQVVRALRRAIEDGQRRPGLHG